MFIKLIRFIYSILFILLLIGNQAFSEDIVLRVQVQGPIGPATTEYIDAALAKAHMLSTKALVIELDTPGGLDTSMREIIKSILASSIPVITYVSPSGARAASAGTYILYASHVAAMAPGTNLGAATPVPLEALPGLPPKSPSPSPKDGETPKVEEPPRPSLSEKILNDSVAYIRSLAELRGRNVKWAEKSVTEAASISAKEARKRQVIDYFSNNLTTLISQANGKEVRLLGGTTKLDIKDSIIINYEKDWRIQFLEIITNPNMLYILLLVGIYGLILEFMNPGFFAPGVIGGICLILALYALHILPVNYAGLGLMLLGLCFMVAEAFLPSLGVLGIGGLIAFVVGSVFLMEGGVPGFEVSWTIIGLMGLLSFGFLTLIMTMMLKSRKNPARSGKEEMVGKRAYVQTWEDSKGYVWFMGESWEATGEKNLAFNDPVIVKKVKGIQLKIQKDPIKKRKIT